MQKIILQLEELVCPTCLQKIETAVGNIDGVQNLKVLFNASKVKAEIDSEKTTVDAVAKVIESVGFDVLSTKVR
ncbi:heavy-metal-associated domain-containing protein [Enterococcus alcedinis]|uniref:Heavy metal-binding protein n=1 Tax=Enterococcus alcedinis TaxID=1274384 RepID=A0A917JFN0_9ENTE|nr:heavy-metal-associated domain-containing protein [Enterococcus alcedinis]MBP2100797.1 copper chaperone CopZ [Enterococcus alcedinis]GGI64905.1 heavy metal-binding protein [Enterococcus alcedinis]